MLPKGVVLKYMLNKFTVLEGRDSFVVDVSVKPCLTQVSCSATNR